MAIIKFDEKKALESKLRESDLSDEIIDILLDDSDEEFVTGKDAIDPFFDGVDEYEEGFRTGEILPVETATDLSEMVMAAAVLTSDTLEEIYSLIDGNKKDCEKAKEKVAGLLNICEAVGRTVDSFYLRNL